MRRVTVQVVTGLIAVGVAAAGFFFLAGVLPDDTAARAAASDAARIFCLSNEHRTQLTEAAANLAVAIPEDELRDGTGPRFDRVCAAVTGAARIPLQAAPGSPTPGESVPGVLLSVSLGALLAWLTGFWRDERTQSRLLADTLRTTAGTYFSAARAQRRKWFESRQGKLPVDQIVLDSRDELAGQLRKVAVQRPGWTVPQRLHEWLSDAQLGESMNDLKPGESREQRDKALREDLTALSDSIDDVVGALERPWRWHRDMRANIPARAEVTSV